MKFKFKHFVLFSLIILNLFQITWQLGTKNAFKIKMNYKLEKKKNQNKLFKTNQFPSLSFQTENESQQNQVQKGWVHYIKYLENRKIPSKFFQNPSFEKQNKYHDFLKDKVNFLFIFILGVFRNSF